MKLLKGSGPVLLVDDDEGARDIARAVFQRSKLQNRVTLLASGPALLAYLADVEAGSVEKPALILLDLNMPGMDGYDTLQALRAMPSFAKEPAVIVFTVSNDPRDTDRALAAGADSYQVKPFGIAEFVEFLNSLV